MTVSKGYGIKEAVHLAQPLFLLSAGDSQAFPQKTEYHTRVQGLLYS